MSEPLRQSAAEFPQNSAVEAPTAGRPAWARSRHAWFWGASLLICLGGYPDVVFGGRTFLPIGRTAGAYDQPPFAAGYRGPPSDRAELDPGSEAWAVHPWSYQEHRALAQGELPLWNRHNGLGHPLLANGETATFNPLHLLVVLWPDRPLAWDAYFLLLRLMAALASCYLLFALGAPKELAVLGAPFAALNGSFTIFVNRGDLAAYALLPLVLLGLVRLRRAPSLRSAAAFAVAFSLCLTSGHPEPAFASLLICGLVALGFSALPSAASSGRYLAFAAGGAAVAVLACAPYWLPFLVRVGQAWSSHPAGTGLDSRPAFLALQWLVPNSFAHRMRGLFDPPENLGFLGAFAGVVALIGIIAAVALAEGRRQLVWIAGPLFLALRVYGAPFTLWISKLPLLDRMTFEMYFQFPVLFCLGIGGILGVSLLAEASAALRAAIVWAAGLVAVGAILLAPLYTPSSALSLFWPRDMLLYAPAVVLAAVLAWASVNERLRPPLRAWARGLLFLCVAAELGSYREHLAVRGNPTAVPGYATWLQQRQETGLPFRVFGLSLTMMPNFATAFGLEDVRLCDALVSRAYVAFEQRFLQKALRWNWFLTAKRADGFNPDSPILDWLNVRYLVGSPSWESTELRSVFRDGTRAVVLENRFAWPRIFAVDRPLIEKSETAVLDRVGELARNHGGPYAVVGPGFPQDRWRALCGADCAAESKPRMEVRDLRYGLNTLAFAVTMAGPAVLVVSDLFDPGWIATVDGVEQQIFPVNYLFRGLIVGPGPHAVRFRYWPREWPLALLLGACGWILIAAGFASGRRTRGREGGACAPSPSSPP